MKQMLGRQLALQFCIALALAGITRGQTTPRDVDGWGKVKWGMSVADAQTAYAADATDSTVVPGPAFTYIDKLTIEHIKIGDMNAEASLKTLRGVEKISQVELSFPEAKANQNTRSEAYETLKGLLIQKYGAPANEDRKPEGDDVVKTILWTFPSTSILLRWWESTGGYNIGFVDVRYTAVDRKTQDAL